MPTTSSSLTTRAFGHAMQLFCLALFLHQIHNPGNRKLLDQATPALSAVSFTPRDLQCHEFFWASFPFEASLNLVVDDRNSYAPFLSSFLNVFWHMYLLHPSTQTPTLDPGNCTILEKSQAVMKRCKLVVQLSSDLQCCISLGTQQWFSYICIHI